MSLAQSSSSGDISLAQPMSVRKVAVIGPSGSLGPAVVKHLSASGFQITLLTRDPAKLLAAKFPSDIKVVRADYTSVASLAPALSGHDAVVDLTNRVETELQLRVIDATIAAKVPRLVPSCFGVGSKNPQIRTFPHVAGKFKMQDYVVQRSKGGELTFTGIQTGMFLELALQIGTLVNTKDDGPTALYDGGDRPMSMTSIDSIGKAVATALKRPEETKNRFLYIHNVVVTQNKMLRFAKDLAPQKKWEVINKDTAEMERASWEAWKAGDKSPRAMIGFFVRGGFGEGFEGHFENVDNNLLGIDMYSDAELMEIFAGYI